MESLRPTLIHEKRTWNKKKHENRPGTMNNQPEIMKNQPWIMKKHENPPETMNNQPEIMKKQKKNTCNHEKSTLNHEKPWKPTWNYE